jgi:hypothetical protein
MSRRWEGICEPNPSTAPFEDRIRELSKTEDLDVCNLEDFDKLLLCTKSLLRAIYYCTMKAFGNHFWMEDEASTLMLSYNSNVASVFQVSTTDARDVFINYIKVVKDILKLDYGLLFTSIVLLKCQWAKRANN